MDVRRRDHEYREADVLSATPERLVVLLYDKMVRDLGEARGAIRNGDVGTAIDRARHAQLIVSELVQGEFQILPGVGGGNLGADPGLALRYHRVEEADHIDPFFQQGFQGGISGTGCIQQTLFIHLWKASFLCSDAEVGHQDLQLPERTLFELFKQLFLYCFIPVFLRQENKGDPGVRER